MSSSTILALQLLASATILSGSLIAIKKSSKKHAYKIPGNAAPIACINEDDLFQRPREAYENALTENGHVVGVWRKGRLEYIVDELATREVLTSDSIFSFEEGTAMILNMHYFYKLFGSFFHDIDNLVRNGIIARMEEVIEQASPIFFKHADRAIKRSHLPVNGENGAMGSEYLDMFDYAHKNISEAMVLVMLGPAFVTAENMAIFERVAMDIAVLTGIYQNTSRFSRNFASIWRWITCSRVVVCSILFGFFRVIGPQVWAELRAKDSALTSKDIQKIDPETKQGSILDFLAAQDKQRALELGTKPSKIASFFHIMGVILGITFASVHQTASVSVWVVFELARRPEYLECLREELVSNTAVDPVTGHPCISYEALQNAVKLDSFIREVMRTKGDTLSTCRLTTKDVELEGAWIPKGSLVIPLATLSHMSPKYHGPDAADFVGERWVPDRIKAATVSPSYFPFGLGRWACPGRVLAVSEIKMMIWSIIGRATPILKNNSYWIVDPLNITSVPPEGEITFIPIASGNEGTHTARY